MDMHIAENHEALLDYLYEEGDPAERLAIATHLQECAQCSVAVLEFQSVRGMMRSWAPPQADLGFRIVQDNRQSATIDDRRSTLPRWAPVWLQAAAAVLLFVSGMAVSQLRVDYTGGTLVVRTRSAQAPVPVNAAIPAPAAPAPQQVVDIDALERELRARLTSGTDASGGGDSERLLQRVRAMIDQSEQRQHRELALRLSQVAGEVDAQHQADLMRIQQSMGQTQEVMDYLVRTSGGVK